MQCPSCEGLGGHKEPILDDGTGPWFVCGWCVGTGEVTREDFYRCLSYLGHDGKKTLRNRMARKGRRA